MTDPTDLDLTETDADVAFPSASPNQYDDLTIDDDGDEEEGDEIGRTVRTRSADPEITSLFDKHKRGRLVAQPEFQRMYVWDRSKASRLIESALLDIPLPIVYLSEEPDGREYVIDGQQRLTSFFSFMDGSFPNGRVFKLQGLKVLPELNGLTFKELNEDAQDKVRYYTIRTITFTRDSDPDLKFEVFERLNTGSVQLNAQELRNCIYRGRYNTLLKELAQDETFRTVVGLRNQERRMKDVELVLRFAAFYHATYLKYKSPIKRFLNEDMERYRSLSDGEAADLRRAFSNAVHNVQALLGEHAFRRYYRGTEESAGYWETRKFNTSLYDVLMVTLAEVDKALLHRHLDSVREALIELMTDDQEFIDSILLSTSSVQAVRKRFDKWREALGRAMKGDRGEPRCFSLALKKELYETDPTCSICGNQIQTVDDAAVDHVEQYWAGGRTIPENARLTHRYCNWARSRTDVVGT
ncbi:MAG: hypothetical protein CMM84_01180 [Rhodothermaceae bacterium]|nr:hypothetical protein [Rhodothermaceae bacterium]